MKFSIELGMKKPSHRKLFKDYKEKTYYVKNVKLKLN